MVDVDPFGLDAESLKRVALRGQLLRVGRDAGVADLQFAHDSKCAGMKSLCGISIRTGLVRIVDTARHRVCQTLPVPGASGGIALDSVHRLAYVSGLQASLWLPTQFTLPGARG